MAVVGRKPKPTALRLLEGNREHRPINRHEPKPQVVLPECPSFVEGYAREVWNELGAQLVGLGVMTAVDWMGFVALCMEWATYVEAKEVLKGGSVWTAESGYKQSVPEVKIANEALGKVKALLAEFGLTPSSRARLSIKNDEDDDWGDLID